MKPPVLLIAAAVGFTATGAWAQFAPGQSANLVLGPPDFTSIEPFTASQSAMNSPKGVAVDPVSGKVFVSVSEHHRVLRFANLWSLANGADAEAVIGQATYTSTVQDTTATNFRFPGGIDVDHRGRLWVADFENNRVLMFNDAANLPEFGASANLVLGQQDALTGDPGTSRTQMSGPSGVHVDADENLWVAEYWNNRVLKFANVSSLKTGAPAQRVLGQPDFESDVPGTSISEMREAAAVIVDAAGRLWVADQGNHRVLRFDRASRLVNGASADGVLGQADFDTDTLGSTPQKLNLPSALAIDRAGSLFIADPGNHRVLFHKKPSSKPNGASADGVVGQTDLTTATEDTTSKKLSGPSGGVDFDQEGNLWVADSGNNRVVRFSGDWSISSPSIVGKVPKFVQDRKLSLKGTAADPSGVAEILYRIDKGPFKAAKGTTAWSLSLKLKPGKNKIEVFVVDGAGNVSAPKVMRVRASRMTR